MAKKERERVLRPVCKEHWDKMRKEALQGLPFWTRPIAGMKIKQVLRDRGFVESDSDCAYCKTETDVNDVD